MTIFNKLGDMRSTADCNLNIGSLYHNLYFNKNDTILSTNEYITLENYFNSSLNLYYESNDLYRIAMSLGNLATIKINYVKSHKSKSSYLFAAIKDANKSLVLSDSIGALFLEYDAYFALFNAYKKLKQFDKALKYNELYLATKDSVHRVEQLEAMEEMETRYQAEKKQLKIEKLEKEKALQTETIARKEAENKKQRILIFSFIAGFILIVVFSVFLYRLFLQKKKANILLASQKKLIESQKKDITDSIFYAKKIQQAILPTKEYTGRILGEHFIMFRAKDIVSGDFYWATKTRRMDDCNGSRLYRTWRSGSFMSMLGVSFLNEIVRKKEVTNMAEVLNLLRSSVIEALRQTGEKGTRKDGMDMSIIAIHKDRKRALWAGANNPLWIIRNENIGKDYEDKTEMIEETKADKMPVTVHIFMDDFTNHEIKIKTGDKLFLFSDGYPDQFGGPKGAKFKYKAFQRLLAETSNLTMKEQGEQLEKTLDNWMNYNENKYEQIDDITIVGLKI